MLSLTLLLVALPATTPLTQSDFCTQILLGPAHEDPEAPCPETATED